MGYCRVCVCVEWVRARAAECVWGGGGRGRHGGKARKCCTLPWTHPTSFTTVFTAAEALAEAVGRISERSIELGFDTSCTIFPARVCALASRLPHPEAAWFPPPPKGVCPLPSWCDPTEEEDSSTTTSSSPCSSPPSAAPPAAAAAPAPAPAAAAAAAAAAMPASAVAAATAGLAGAEMGTSSSAGRAEAALSRKSA